MRFLKVHIISDGTPNGTKVTDLATGKDIPVVEIKWKNSNR